MPISLAMRYQGHAKEEIHRAYQDIKARDLTVCADAVGSGVEVSDIPKPQKTQDSAPAIP